MKNLLCCVYSEAVDMAQNRPLGRLLLVSGATQRYMPETTIIWLGDKTK